jgi:predicted PolB exonuclease-like 3'-5' exonuclease
MDEKISQFKIDVEVTKVPLPVDVEFSKTLKKKYQMRDKEPEVERQEDREKQLAKLNAEEEDLPVLSKHNSATSMRHSVHVAAAPFAWAPEDHLVEQLSMLLKKKCQRPDNKWGAQRQEDRAKQRAEFNAEEKDSRVLSKHNSAALLPRSAHEAAAPSVQTREDYFDAACTFKQSYVPQLGEIFEIMEKDSQFKIDAEVTKVPWPVDIQFPKTLKKKQLAELNAEEKDLPVLSKHNSAASVRHSEHVAAAPFGRAPEDHFDEQLPMMLKRKCQTSDKKRSAQHQEDCMKQLAEFNAEEKDSQALPEPYLPATQKVARGSRSTVCLSAEV